MARIKLLLATFSECIPTRQAANGLQCKWRRGTGAVFPARSNTGAQECTLFSRDVRSLEGLRYLAQGTGGEMGEITSEGSVGQKFFFRAEKVSVG